MINRILIEKFKAYRTPQSIELAPLTLIVGENNAGKSTLLDAISIIASGFERMEGDWWRSWGHLSLRQTKLPHLDFTREHVALEYGSSIEVEVVDQDESSSLSYTHHRDPERESWVTRVTRSDKECRAHSSRVFDISDNIEIHYFVPLMYCITHLQDWSAAATDLNTILMEPHEWPGESDLIISADIGDGEVLKAFEWPLERGLEEFVYRYEYHNQDKATGPYSGNTWGNFLDEGKEDSPFHRLLDSAAEEMLDDIESLFEPDFAEATIVSAVQGSIDVFRRVVKSGTLPGDDKIRFSELFSSEEVRDFWGYAATTDFFAKTCADFRSIRFGWLEDDLVIERLGGDALPYQKQVYLAGEKLPTKHQLDTLQNDLETMGLEAPVVRLHEADVGGVRQLRIREAEGVDHAVCDLGLGIRRLIPLFLDTAASDYIAYSKANEQASRWRASRINPGRGIVMLEEPEAHLHQQAQANVGDLLLKKLVDGREHNLWKQLLVETHSPHLIYRILRRIRETANGTLEDGAPEAYPHDISILCVEKHKDGTPGSFVRPLRIGPNGELFDPLPPDFFESTLSDRMKGWPEL